MRLKLSYCIIPNSLSCVVLIFLLQVSWSGITDALFFSWAEGKRAAILTVYYTVNWEGGKGNFREERKYSYRDKSEKRRNIIIQCFPTL